MVVRHEPTMRMPFNVRSFFTPQGSQAIGSGIVLWRGFFQSVRPAIGRMLINLDIATATMYKPGELITLALDFLGSNNSQPQVLAQSRGFPDRKFHELARFLQGVKVVTSQGGSPRAVKRLHRPGANALTFKNKEGKTISVADYFRQTYNKPLRFPELPCVEVRLV